MKNIVLIGMPGSGKTTFGRALSRELNRPFVDADDYLPDTGILEKYVKSGKEGQFPASSRKARRHSGMQKNGLSGNWQTDKAS